MKMRSNLRMLAAAVLSLALLSCGSASNNDQGVSFTLFGFCADVSCSTGQLGTTTQLSNDSELNNVGYVSTFYALQNNLANQGIRTQRAFMDYFVEGSSVQPPSTSSAVGAVMGPAQVTGADPGGSLPPGFAKNQNIAYVGVPIVPPDVMAWLNLHRNELPELPISMTVHTYVTGITTSGDQLDTNPLDFRVTFLPDNTIEAGGAGSSSSAGLEEEPTSQGEL